MKVQNVVYNSDVLLMVMVIFFCCFSLGVLGNRTQLYGTPLPPIVNIEFGEKDNLLLVNAVDDVE